LKTQLLATTRYQEDLRRRAIESVEEHDEIAALQAYWAV